MDTSLRSLFSLFREHASPSPRQLTQLQLLLDDECLRHSGNAPSSFLSMDDTPDLIGQIAEYLSGPLSQVQSLDSSGNRIQQLRALVASLALLHHLGAEELHPKSYNKLRQNILDRYSEITSGRPPSKANPEQFIRHKTNLYLIMLVAQYFSLFRRSGPRHEAFIAPVLGLVLAGASIASGQYNSIQHVFKYFDQIIAEIPGPRKRDLTLPALQEITRNTVSMRRQPDSDKITEALLEASQLIQKVLETRLDDQIKPRIDRLDWIYRVSGRVPQLRNWDFTYGTLDCAIQLARAFGPSTVSPGLQQTIQRLVFESSDEYFRWKGVSTTD
ncbi:MAG: hypothetical protein Q9195_001198 [Heterodermia aff. obscurata]